MDNGDEHHAGKKAGNGNNRNGALEALCLLPVLPAWLTKTEGA